MIICPSSQGVGGQTLCLIHPTEGTKCPHAIPHTHTKECDSDKCATTQTDRGVGSCRRPSAEQMTVMEVNKCK